MFKKAVGFSLIAVLAAGMMAACGSSEPADTGSAASSVSASSEAVVTATGTGVEDGVLTVGFDAEFPPYGYMDENGEYVGFDLDLAQAVCDMEGWTLEKKPINWDSKDMELNSGSIDCIWNGFTINGREDDYTFSQPYVDNSQVIVVAADSGIASFADLADKTVGVQAASAALGVLQEDQKDLADTFKELKEFGDYNTAFTELKAGALDALAIDIGVANYQIASRGDGFVVLDEQLNAEQYGVGFRLGNTELCGIVDADLVELAKDGTVKTVAEKYDIDPEMICIVTE